MSQFIKDSSGKIVPGKESSSLKLTIRDTDFLLRLIAQAPIDGRELEQALETKNKIQTIHQKLSEVGM
tara:strand:+ start:435 stop:638 length:204 start_codon:yes stop_codon:yes gene_type:complete